MFITFTNRTHYQMQNTVGARMFEVRQSFEVTDADGANLKAMGLARDATREEIAALKAQTKDGEEYVAPAPKSPKPGQTQPAL